MHGQVAMPTGTLRSPRPAAVCVVRATTVSTSLREGQRGSHHLQNPPFPVAVQSCQRWPSALAAVDTFITRRRWRLRTGTKW